MNSLSDILSGRMEDIFPATTTQQPSTPVNLPITPLQETQSFSVPPQPVQEVNEPSAPVTPKETPSLDVAKLRTSLQAMRDQIDSILHVLGGATGSKLPPSPALDLTAVNTSSNDRVVEGVFNGEKMVGPDGREYSVPPNYSSKSKLVEGDIMKLTITHSGSFIYKQIHPTPRKRIVGELHRDDAGQWNVVVEGKPYRVLTASITFYKGQPGDEVVILVPEDGGANWGAVDNLIRKVQY